MVEEDFHRLARGQAKPTLRSDFISGICLGNAAFGFRRTGVARLIRDRAGQV
jgi:hypothetical protein